tara:strand:+ start:1109 stop:1981 length:873 start_codon:yes stop_codon:yes gene_type:complete
MKNQKPTSEEQTNTKPALVLIATPIGNLEDISIRAVREMRNTDLLCCEDTRRTGKLLELLEIQPRPDLLLLNEHNEQTRSAEVIKKILNGQRVALVSDAGLPGISDPGEYLVSKAIQHGVIIEVIPGPSAGITALVASGLPTKRFVFQGFIPRKGKARNNRLAEIAAEKKTTIIYESGNRLQKTIEDLLAICDKDREVTIAKELTKIHEEYIRGTLCELQETLQSRSTKGEYVLVVGGLQDQREVDDNQLLLGLKELRSQGKSNRDAINEIAKKYNVSKRRVYGLSIERL